MPKIKVKKPGGRGLKNNKSNMPGTPSASDNASVFDAPTPSASRDDLSVQGTTPRRVGFKKQAGFGKSGDLKKTNSPILGASS